MERLIKMVKMIGNLLKFVTVKIDFSFKQIIIFHGYIKKIQPTSGKPSDYSGSRGVN